LKKKKKKKEEEEEEEGTLFVSSLFCARGCNSPIAEERKLSILLHRLASLSCLCSPLPVHILIRVSIGLSQRESASAEALCKQEKP
jgi:hypothetical protein